MNKAEFIEAVADHAELTKADAGRAVDAMITAITKALKKGDTVTLVGFGTFSVRKRGARTGRNPRTGETIKIKASKKALSVVRARTEQLGLPLDFLQKHDVHVHVPDGATPKDGPSAGIAMATALVSMLTKIPVRHDVAMTGEITLRGKVTAIGGLKEKLLAALRGGITTVIIPEENRKDLAEIPANVTRNLKIVPVKWIDEVLDLALERPLPPRKGEGRRGGKRTPAVAAPARPRSRGRSAIRH